MKEHRQYLRCTYMIKNKNKLNDKAKGKWKLVTKDMVNDYGGKKCVMITLRRYCL
jgi:hypothetical protein